MAHYNINLTTFNRDENCVAWGYKKDCLTILYSPKFQMATF